MQQQICDIKYISLHSSISTRGSFPSRLRQLDLRIEHEFSFFAFPYLLNTIILFHSVTNSEPFDGGRTAAMESAALAIALLPNLGGVVIGGATALVYANVLVTSMH